MPQVIHSAAEGKKFNTETSLTVVECFTCKILYAIPQGLYHSAQEYPGDSPNGWKLCCPLGHTWWFTGKNVEQKLRESKEEIDRQKRFRLEERASARARLDQEKAHAAAMKGVATRFKNQRDRDRLMVANGVCPCCKRSFKQVSRHMKSQHPEYVELANKPTTELAS